MSNASAQREGLSSGERLAQRGLVLMLVRDERLAVQLAARLQRYTLVRRAREHQEAATWLRENAKWGGVVLDVEGLEEELGILRQLRSAHPRVPMLTVASRASAAFVNGSYMLRSELLLKPIAEKNLMTFLRRALVYTWLPDERVSASVDELAQARRLTARELQLLAYALGNEPRSRMMRRLGISENTLKTQVRGLLRKCGARSMDALAHMVLRQALILGSAHAGASTREDEVENDVPRHHSFDASGEGPSPWLTSAL